MKGNDIKLPLPSVDDLFEDVAGKDILNIEKVIPISSNKLDPYPKNPFKVKDDEDMAELVEQVLKVGIVTPLIVRQKPNGRYEILSGHRRKRACEIAKIEEIPCVIRNYNDDEAKIIIVDSNQQRSNILPSEKAFAYKMRIEAEKRQGQRNDLTSSQVATKLKGVAEKVGKMYGDSRDKVYRYVRLTELIPELLNLVDIQTISLTPAVELSYLKEDEQHIILDIYKCDEITPNVSQAKHLKKLSQENNLTAEKIENIMQQKKANQIEKIKLNYDNFRKILPKNIITDKEIENFLIKCVEEHNQRQKNRNSYSR